MTRPDNHTLRFACPRCMSPLKARLELAGTWQRCPRCQLRVKVPEKTLLSPPIEEYALREPETPPAVPPVVAPPVVPPPVASASPQARASPEAPPVGPVEQRSADEGLIRVQCLLCGTLMYATEDQIGQKITCPDCQVPAVVTRPIKAPPRQYRSASEIGEYALSGRSVRSAAGGPAEPQDGVTVSCPVCHSQLRAGLDQVGTKIACGDCGTVLIVPPPPPEAVAVQKADGPGEYGPAAGSDANVWGAAPANSTPAPVAEKPRVAAAVERALELDAERPKMPRWLFLDGTFTFPFTFGALAFTFVLATWVILPIWLGKTAIELAKVELATTFFGSAFVGAVAVVLGTMWFALASACALSVVRDTSNGCDKIETWPDLAFIDWIVEPLFLFNSISLSVLPCLGITWWTTRSVELTGWAALSGFFLFPIFLLSMLDKNSLLAVLSPAIFRTFWRAWTGWVRFYFLTALLMAALIGVSLAAYAVGPNCAVIAVAIGLGIGWMIYFRMLGRLAWFCTVRTAVVEPEEPEAKAKRSPDKNDALLEDDGP